jgi:predicted component of viral defense system (DUF524 family)
MLVLSDKSIPFRSPSGRIIARVNLTPVRFAEEDHTTQAPLIEVDPADANEFGETRVQLRESERYEYEVDVSNGADLRLRCSLSSRRRNLGNAGKPDAGLIETRSYCGTLLLELIDGEDDGTKKAVASASLDVRSIKLDYRTEYRGMLRRLSNEMADLVADVRSSAKVGFRSTFEDRADAGWLQIQLELLRETLDSVNFAAAMQRILSFPHERMATVQDSVATNRQIRWTASAVRQLVTQNPRKEVPASHPLRTQLGLDSIAERVMVPRKSRDLDTPENRFVKFALNELRAFLTHAQGVFNSKGDWQVSAALARRLSATLDDWLGRGLFQEVGEMRFAPLGSPVLQRKAGYREVLRWWLRFRTGAEISWKGGEELFHAGQRNVADLYEYWLFFELLGWFCRKCRNGNRPAAEELIEGLDGGSPNLRLRKRMELGPFDGQFVGQNRSLKARFSYNRVFNVTSDRQLGGSWTRRLHPDYTLTFWPGEFSEEDAEKHELLVHIHFDAKYRVENFNSLFGDEADDDCDDELEGNYKRQDLLKMHAYRDAIKRSQGAYVLYPGRANKEVKLKGFHEILPGLGAFGVAPNENGDAQGFEAIEKFLDEVIEHLGNQTTSQERLSYHMAESYMLKDELVSYDTVLFKETDIYGEGHRALPPAEHMVLVAWYRDQKQLEWTKKDGVAIVRLGKREGAWHVQPEFSTARHMLLHSRGGVSPPGLWRLRTPGYKVYTDTELKKKGYPGLPGGEIYALFEVEPDPTWENVKWDTKGLIRVIRDFESRIKHRIVKNIGRRSAYPRILPIKDLLRARLNL